ncbi:MAG: hypothetical protein ACI4U3_05325 [Traorella sp.]
MKKNNYSILLFGVSLLLAILSWILLPQQVIIQFNLSESHVNQVPKLFAVLLAFALSGGFSIASYFVKNQQNKYQLISLIGILVFVTMLIVNLI